MVAKEKYYTISFDYCGETKKAYNVGKNTKTIINKYFWIPKSILGGSERYSQSKKCYGCSYSKRKIELVIPKWFVEKELGFYK